MIPVSRITVQAPAKTPLSEKSQKRGFKFTGPVADASLALVQVWLMTMSDCEWKKCVYNKNKGNSDFAVTYTVFDGAKLLSYLMPSAIANYLRSVVLALYGSFLCD